MFEKRQVTRILCALCQRFATTKGNLAANSEIGYSVLAHYAQPATPAESVFMYEHANRLPIGSRHYRSFVGPPMRYGDMSATQFTLLYLGGLQETDMLLDVGCGALRLGRLAIPFLQPGHYHCIEPNPWLIRDALHFELGEAILSVKSPAFAFNANFDRPVVRGRRYKYHFVIAQSIFSHTGQNMYMFTLKKLAKYFHNDTIMLATSVPTDVSPELSPCSSVQGWLYPQSCSMSHDAVLSAANDSTLLAVPLAWPHERQQWYAYCRDCARGRLRCERLARMMPDVAIKPWAVRSNLDAP